jgi:hypothetical protein
MSLWITVYVRKPGSGELEDDPRATLESQLGGVEAWRTEVWGSEALRKRARFLPILANEDLYVEAHELAAFRAECEALLRDIVQIAAELGYTDGGETIAFRLNNFVTAAQVADPERGVVCVS